MLFQTEYDFTLPRGYVDAQGELHRHGKMRLATALDEVTAMGDTRVKKNAEYLSVLLLARVVEQIDGVGAVTEEVIGGLFPADFEYLQNMYETINHVEDPMIQVQCPHCGKSFADTLNFATGE